MQETVAKQAAMIELLEQRSVIASGPPHSDSSHGSTPHEVVHMAKAYAAKAMLNQAGPDTHAQNDPARLGTELERTRQANVETPRLHFYVRSSGHRLFSTSCRSIYSSSPNFRAQAHFNTALVRRHGSGAWASMPLRFIELHVLTHVHLPGCETSLTGPGCCSARAW